MLVSGIEEQLTLPETPTAAVTLPEQAPLPWRLVDGAVVFAIPRVETFALLGVDYA